MDDENLNEHLFYLNELVIKFWQIEFTTYVNSNNLFPNHKVGNLLSDINLGRFYFAARAVPR